MSERCACGAEFQTDGRGRRLWRPTRCCDPITPPRVVGRLKTVPDQRLCVICSGRFCILPHRPHLACSRECAAALKGHIVGDGLSFNAGRWYVCTRGGLSYAYARAVMSAHLRRELDPSEIVHHMNGNPSDDRIENLQLVTRAEHLAIHRYELEVARGLHREAA